MTPPAPVAQVEPLLTGKVALITGAASGQGRAASILFAAHGATIVIADVNDAGADETLARVDAAGSTGVAIHADVSRREDCDAMVSTALDSFGRLDVLYNNAAIQMSGRLTETSEDDWERTIATNLSAVFWACRAALPHLGSGRSQGDGPRAAGSIINTASVLGLIGSEGYAAYGASKAGLVALTRQIASEFGPAVRANVIAPGSIDTPRFRAVAQRQEPAFVASLEKAIPLHRLGSPGDVAGIALFLASELSAYVTGAVIPADGGLAVYR